MTLIFSSISSKVPLERPVIHDSSTDRQGLEREYLAATFEPLAYYSVETWRDGIAENGEHIREKDDRFFQLLGAQIDKTREHTMHTHESAGDRCKHSNLLLHILPLTFWEPPWRTR